MDEIFARLYEKDGGLGKPFEFYTVIPKGKINTGVKCKSILSNRKEYYFPIILDGQIKSILNVYKRVKDSTWVASGIGNEILARELFVIRKQWPNEKGYNPYILEFPTIQKVYFSIPEVDDKNMTEIDINNKIDSSSFSNSNSPASPRSVSLNYAKLNNIDMVLDTINARASHIGSSKADGVQ